jgi:hypothetical protein
MMIKKRFYLCLALVLFSLAGCEIELDEPPQTIALADRYFRVVASAPVSNNEIRWLDAAHIQIMTLGSLETYTVGDANYALLNALAKAMQDGDSFTFNADGKIKNITKGPGNKEITLTAGGALPKSAFASPGFSLPGSPVSADVLFAGSSTKGFKLSGNFSESGVTRIFAFYTSDAKSTYNGIELTPKGNSIWLWAEPPGSATIRTTHAANEVVVPGDSAITDLTIERDSVMPDNSAAIPAIDPGIRIEKSAMTISASRDATVNISALGQYTTVTLKGTNSSSSITWTISADPTGPGPYINYNSGFGSNGNPMTIRALSGADRPTYTAKTGDTKTLIFGAISIYGFSLTEGEDEAGATITLDRDLDS